MNCIWILLLLCCCGNNTKNEEHCGCRHDMIQPRRNERRGYPCAPFAPDCEERRERRHEHDCGCRASEMADVSEDDCQCEA